MSANCTLASFPVDQCQSLFRPFSLSAIIDPGRTPRRYRHTAEHSCAHRHCPQPRYIGSWIRARIPTLISQTTNTEHPGSCLLRRLSPLQSPTLEVCSQILQDGNLIRTCARPLEARVVAGCISLAVSRGVPILCSVNEMLISLGWDSGTPSGMSPTPAAFQKSSHLPTPQRYAFHQSSGF